LSLLKRASRVLYYYLKAQKSSAWTSDLKRAR